MYGPDVAPSTRPDREVQQGGTRLEEAAGDQESFDRLPGYRHPAAASLPEFVYASDLEPSSRWFGPGRDVVELIMSGGGRMSVPGQPIERLLVPGRLVEASTLLLDLPAQTR